MITLPKAYNVKFITSTNTKNYLYSDYFTRGKGVANASVNQILLVFQSLLIEYTQLDSGAERVEFSLHLGILKESSEIN